VSVSEDKAWTAPRTVLVEGYLSRESLAEYFDVSTSLVDKWRKLPGFPPEHRVLSACGTRPGGVGFKASEVDRWQRELTRVRLTTTDASEAATATTAPPHDREVSPDG
jgi:hypothetical protein